MRFIRKNGRIIPILKGGGVARDVVAGAASVGVLSATKEQKLKTKPNLIRTSYAFDVLSGVASAFGLRGGGKALALGSVASNALGAAGAATNVAAHYRIKGTKKAKITSIARREAKGTLSYLGAMVGTLGLMAVKKNGFTVLKNIATKIR